ncbi:hypothetical protein WICMUC_003054 [Wickerhamomyces mucosus]|uniref:SWI5-dependent HO expression protein 3 n=1 Tax=Wickerhamomyces mucosus TaxID=1378264 RepID=A0A9P8TD85_9ASCO|nr:hypothetical protein WICMUC_003054 [Wickerhamomyces mucosus]
MPPQFFKDASMNVGINNKFTPRAFSLNFGSNDSNTKVFSKSLPPNVSSNSALDLQKESTTVNSVCLPRVLLDVTADNGASKNDGGKPQTYNVDFLKDKTQGEVIRHGTLNKLGVLPKNQRASGHNNIVDGDDDDIQITDIRDVSVDFSADNKCFDNVTGEKSLYTEKHRSVPEMTYISDESNPSLQFENTSNTSEQSSGGVLLEALYKSQKVCNQLRDKMESANVKIAYQDEKLVSQQNSVENLKLTINKLQDKLNSLRSESQELKDSRRSDNEAIKNTKNECLELSSSLSGYKIELSEFKKRIDYLKQIKQSSNYEISKKNKEISILQQRLDETSGLLSEQKIKTAELERIVSSCREKYDKKIDDYMNNYNTFETKITEDITTAIDRVSRDMRFVIPELVDDISIVLTNKYFQFLSGR